MMYFEFLIFLMHSSSDCNQKKLPIQVKLLLSIDRSQGLDFARRVVELTIDYGQKRNDVIVGLDVSGNMTNSNLIDYFPLLEKIKNAGLRLTGTNNIAVIA